MMKRNEITLPDTVDNCNIFEVGTDKPIYGCSGPSVAHNTCEPCNGQYRVTETAQGYYTELLNGYEGIRDLFKETGDAKGLKDLRALLIAQQQQNYKDLRGEYKMDGYNEFPSNTEIDQSKIVSLEKPTLA